MNPIMSAWLVYIARLEQQPKWDQAEWAVWQADCEALSDWFNTLRRLTV